MAEREGSADPVSLFEDASSQLHVEGVRVRVQDKAKQAAPSSAIRTYLMNWVFMLKRRRA